MNEDELTSILIKNLENGEIERLTRVHKTNNVSLYREVGDGSFRADIFISLTRKGVTAFENSKIRFVAVEVKISDWKQGLYQAWRYNSFAEKSYLAIYKPNAEKVEIDLFREYNVGLVVFDEKTIQVLNRPRTNKFTKNTYEFETRQYLWERLSVI